MAVILEKKGPGIRRLTLAVGVALVLAACGGDAVEEDPAVYAEETPGSRGAP
jgi:hypothetical protein